MRRFVLVSVVGLLAAAGCSSAEGPSGSTEQGAHVCPLLEIYCPPECHQSEGGCPRQCHCAGYTACGPTLKCGQAEVCCTSPVVNQDPSLNHYWCSPPGSMCPL